MDSKENNKIKEKYNKLMEQKTNIEKELLEIKGEYFNAKIYRAEVYIIDVNGDYGGNPFDVIDNHYGINYFNMEERNIFWCDDIDINKCDATLEAYRSYFNE